MVIKGSLYATVTDGENHIQPKTCLQERDRGWSEGGVGGEQRAGRTGRAGLSDSNQINRGIRGRRACNQRHRQRERDRKSVV